MNHAKIVACTVFAGSALVASIAAPTSVAQTFPSKAIRIIVPFSPGGTSDIVARHLAPRLAADLGHNVLVDNRAGAGSMLGTELAAKSAPDGHTLVLNNIGLAFNETMYAKRGYDALRDLAPISLVGYTPNLFATHPSLPVKNVAEFLALAKKHRNELRYASGGIGSSSHLAVELLKLMAGLQMIHVPYKGSGPALIDVASGQVHFMINSMPAVINHVNSGRLRALAVSGIRRSPAVPHLPTIAEAGVPGYEFSTWYGVLAPATTPRQIISRLNIAMEKSLRIADLAATLKRQGIEPESSNPEKFGKIIAGDIAKWRKVISEANIQSN
jgi:tripartite-type tricarboxylate transporter receptor subunit TctC